MILTTVGPTDRLMELHIPGQEESKYFLLTCGVFNYQQIVSFDYFIHRELKRAFPSQVGDWMSYAKTIKYCSEFAYGAMLQRFIDNGDMDYDVTVCNSTYELYEAMGYDRKKQKYID